MANGFGGFAATWAVLWVMFGVPLAVIIPTAVIAAVFFSGYFITPFVAFIALRRRDLVLDPTTITVDADGISYATRAATGTQSWSVYRRARDVGNAIVLEAAPGIAALIPKSGMPGPEREAFMRLLEAHGLLRQATVIEAVRPLLWLTLGVLAAIAQLMFLQR